MNGFLICTGKRTKEHPLYIYETKTNIYSVEELCYYIYNNIETLDEQMFNAPKVADFFIRCDRKDLAEYLERTVITPEKAAVPVEELVRNVFRKVNYYDKSEVEELCLKIRRLSERPMEERLKAMGDAFLKAERYKMAEKKYRMLLDMKVNDNLSDRFYCATWYNLGVVYARMMYFEAAADCFGEAYRLCPEEKVKKARFMALTLTGDRDKTGKLEEDEAVTSDMWQEELKSSFGEKGEVDRLIEFRDAGEVVKYRDGINNLIEKWKARYREQTK